MNRYFIYALIISFIGITGCKEDDGPVNNPPLLSDRTFRIPEEIETGGRVGIISALDLDDDPLTYSIISGNTDNTFELNSANGELTVRSNEKINFLIISQYQLTIEVNDTKSTASALITITIEEANRPPVINEQTFNISEDARPGLEVGTVQAIDPNGDNLTFEITGGNEDELFEIDETSGTLSLISTFNLDFETTDSYILTISAGDPEGLVSSGPVTIEIQDAEEPDASFELDGDNFTMEDGLIREFGITAISGFHSARSYALADGEFSFSAAVGDFVVNGGTIGVFGVLFSSDFFSFDPGEFIYVDTATTTVGDVLGKDFIYSGVIIIDGNDDGSVSISEEDIVYGITAGSITVISNDDDNSTINYNVEVTLYDVASHQYVNTTKADLRFEWTGDFKYSDQRSGSSRKIQAIDHSSMTNRAISYDSAD